MNPFISRLKKICAKIDNREVPLVIDKKQINLDVRYNIHKRSLPVGLDKPIMWGLREEEAKIVIAKLLKSRRLMNNMEEYDWIYYDMVREDGQRSSVFYNPPNIITNEYDGLI